MASLSSGVKPELSEAILQKTKMLQAESDAMKETLANMKVVSDDSSEESPELGSVDEEEYMRMRYYEALRRA